MSDSRVNNKDLAVKLDKLIELMTVQAIAEKAPATPAKADADTGDTTVKVDDAYLTHMKAKCQAHATTKGGEVVLYARKNKGGETKLAYAMRERYDDVVQSQPSHLGAVQSFTA